jgi:hypothetical protein
MMPFGWSALYPWGGSRRRLNWVRSMRAGDGAAMVFRSIDFVSPTDPDGS